MYYRAYVRAPGWNGPVEGVANLVAVYRALNGKRGITCISNIPARGLPQAGLRRVLGNCDYDLIMSEILSEERAACSDMSMYGDDTAMQLYLGME